MNILTFFLLIVCIWPATAQDHSTSANIIVVNTAADLPLGVLWDKTSESDDSLRIEGRRYFEEVPLEGTIVFNGSQKEYLIREIRYNIFSSDLEIKIQGVTKYIRMPSVNYFTLIQSGNKIKFIRWMSPDGMLMPATGYFETLISGEVSVLRYHYAGIESTTILGKQGKRKIFRGVIYHLIKGKNIYKASKRRLIKKILTVPGFNAKKVIKRKRLKIKNIYDLVTLVELYNARNNK